jgi:hypothetical protein
MRAFHEQPESASEPDREQGEEAEYLGDTEGKPDPNDSAETPSPAVEEHVRYCDQELYERRHYGDEQCADEHERRDHESADPNGGELVQHRLCSIDIELVARLPTT